MSSISLDLEKVTMEEVVTALNRGQMTCVQLVEDYLERIERDNIKGRGLRAVIEVAPRTKLLQAAQVLDDERAEGRLRGPLHGIPILIKDTICTESSMGMQTTGGCNAFEGSIVKQNAPIVDLLLEAGILIIGKANLTIFGNFYGEHPNGWSPRGVQCVSAISPGLETGGSSTGCAHGVAAGFCASSIGGETSGSIMSPAAMANLYGLKPTVGLVPAQKVISISFRIDCLGPIGKSTWDVAALLGQVAIPPLDYTHYTQAPHNQLSQYKLGIPRNGFFPGADPDNGLEKTLQDESVEIFKAFFEKLGDAVKTDPADIPDIERLFVPIKGAAEDDKTKRPGSLLMTREFYEAINDHLGSVEGCKVKDLEELVQWNNEHPALAFHDPSKADRQIQLERALRDKGARDDDYHEALATVEMIGHNVERMMDEKDLDVLLFAGCATSRGSAVAATIGFPIATVPIGQLSNKLPCEVRLLARKGHEDKLIGMMAACEALMKGSK